MTNPTSNFGWQMPTPTDLVTDLPADFEVFGQAVDTSMADLKGGTTGQILSKATNTDMDFTWITNDVGDITNIAVTSPITGGGSSGSVTIGVSAATTSASGVVQLSDSTSTTSSVLASTPTATKSAYDLAAAAVPKSTVTTAGDVIYATGSSAVTRLGVGTTGQVLTVAAGVPSWAAGGKVKQVIYAVTATETAVSSTTEVDTTLTATITPTSATSTILVFVNHSQNGGGNTGAWGSNVNLYRGSTNVRSIAVRNGRFITNGTYSVPGMYLDSPATTSATTYKLKFAQNTSETNTMYAQIAGYPSFITLMEIGA